MYIALVIQQPKNNKYGGWLPYSAPILGNDPRVLVATVERANNIMQTRRSYPGTDYRTVVAKITQEVVQPEFVVELKDFSE